MIEKFNKDSISFPIYCLFRDKNVHDIIVDALMNIIYPKQIIDEKESVSKNEHEEIERLRNHSKVKKSVNKPQLKDETKQINFERNDAVTLTMKILAFWMVNSLSTSHNHILKMLSELHDIIDNNDSNLYNEVVSWLLELNGIQFIVIDMLSEKLVEESTNILIKLIFDPNFKDKVIEQLIQPNMFKIIRQAAFKYAKNRELFKQIIIVQQRISLCEPIRLREYATPEYIELLNNELMVEQNNEREELIINTLNNLLKNIQ